MNINAEENKESTKHTFQFRSSADRNESSKNASGFGKNALSSNSTFQLGLNKVAPDLKSRSVMEALSKGAKPSPRRKEETLEPEAGGFKPAKDLKQGSVMDILAKG